MNVLISCDPEELTVDEITIPTIEAAAAKVSELYGLDNAELSVTLTDNEHIHVVKAAAAVVFSDLQLA